MRTIVFAILILVGCVAFGQNKEVLMLDQYTNHGKGNGLYIFREGVEPEHISFETTILLKRSKLLFETITKLYKEGWELKGIMQLDVIQCRYVFDREKP